ncbi:hypothetical protein [Sediminispirochaeta bajacaliforniensis]|uniref:hypothetical protein n=1 Tax=Sediminispirochaeta bajacaliforniensis TaxID=148 RepID=UPI000368986A|nr:hypothetical protein [Sediminispirochaeta bajacaliforniensis]
MGMVDHDATFKDQLRTLYHDRTVNEDQFVERLANIITEHIASAHVSVTIDAGQDVAILPPTPPGAYNTTLLDGTGTPVTGSITTPNEGYELAGKGGLS